MKPSLMPIVAIALTAAVLSPAAALAGANVGVSVSVGQPGYYGQVDIGALPPPAVVYPAPVAIQPVPVGVALPPLYLRVPQAHYHDWRRYCGAYRACGRQVYFVSDAWYRNAYVPYYHQHMHNYHRYAR